LLKLFCDNIWLHLFICINMFICCIYSKQHWCIKNAFNSCFLLRFLWTSCEFASYWEMSIKLHLIKNIKNKIKSKWKKQWDNQQYRQWFITKGR
jgi:hypothetical protein